ncbi:hypothetical protein ES703_52268 [subsurface metagenome]
MEEEIGQITIPENGMILILPKSAIPDPTMKELKGFTAIFSRSKSELYLSWSGQDLPILLSQVRIYIVQEPAEPEE